MPTVGGREGRAYAFNIRRLRMSNAWIVRVEDPWRVSLAGGEHGRARRVEMGRDGGPPTWMQSLGGSARGDRIRGISHTFTIRSLSCHLHPPARELLKPRASRDAGAPNRYRVDPEGPAFGAPLYVLRKWASSRLTQGCSRRGRLEALRTDIESIRKARLRSAGFQPAHARSGAFLMRSPCGSAEDAWSAMKRPHSRRMS